MWFEAVNGYLSAAVEWAALSGDKDTWHDWWYNPDALAYYFIGKDNIPFHAVMWPAQLHGVGEWFGKIFEEKDDTSLILPHDVPANEFMNMEGQQMSGSRNWAVWGLDFLSRYQPDALRFYLTINMPETRDSNWGWEDFVTRNNTQLVANWGNLANRVLSFAYKHWEGDIPTPGKLGSVDKTILETVEKGFESVGELLDAVKLRAALQEALRVASEVNKYLDDTSPWSVIKTDIDAAATTIYTALQCIDNLKLIFAPFLPHSSEQLHTYLGYDNPLFGEQYTEKVSDDLGEHAVLRYRPAKASGIWAPTKLKPGKPFKKPEPLYQKLDESVAEDERRRMG